jgi:hypothetical protein
MPAPKGNQNAAREGTEKKYRVRLPDPADHADVGLLDTIQRGHALIGYLMWMESPESDEISFIEWMKQKTNYGQYDD